MTKCAEVAARILTQLGYTPKEVELARIAAYMHDIGNVVNRHDHALSGATMAFRILDKMGMEPPTWPPSSPPSATTTTPPPTR